MLKIVLKCSESPQNVEICLKIGQFAWKCRKLSENVAIQNDENVWKHGKMHKKL